MEKHDLLPSALTHIEGMHSFMNMKASQREILIGKTHACDDRLCGYCLNNDPSFE